MELWRLDILTGEERNGKINALSVLENGRKFCHEGRIHLNLPLQTFSSSNVTVGGMEEKRDSPQLLLLLFLTLILLSCTAWRKRREKEKGREEARQADVCSCTSLTLLQTFLCTFIIHVIMMTFLEKKKRIIMLLDLNL